MFESIHLKDFHAEILPISNAKEDMTLLTKDIKFIINAAINDEAIQRWFPDLYKLFVPEADFTESVRSLVNIMFTEHRVHYSIRNTKSEVIGFLTFRSFKYMALQLEIYLNEQYRGKKIMSIILGNLLQQTQRSDIMSMTAFVDLENQNSIRLIEKLGFKETNRNGKAIGYEYDFRQVHE